jgi:hypothetical protein
MDNPLQSIASPPASDGKDSGSAERNDPNGLRYESTGLLNPKNAKKKTRIGVFIASVLVTVGHHILLSNLDGHNFECYELSQFWAGNISNAFSTVTIFLLGIAVTQRASLDCLDMPY